MAAIITGNLGWIIVLFIVAVAMITQAFLIAWIYNKRKQAKKPEDNAENKLSSSPNQER